VLVTTVESLTRRCVRQKVGPWLPAEAGCYVFRVGFALTNRTRIDKRGSMNQGKRVILSLAVICAFAASVRGQMVQFQREADSTPVISLTALQPVSGNNPADQVMPLFPTNDGVGTPISANTRISAVPEPSTVSLLLLGLGGSAFCFSLLRARRA
jgi:hypothetical protein